ncbi:hypothetical protein QU593_09685 [Rossellomorea marisflavi]|uniref:hypothetical protein n=1 Tax=Rossellomorea marisflavi TaxID=189381 RepID=UPI0025AED549|nr:hypothetical protein [Rossellomorea marisflavi]WJV20673.1 hypothetical protein QU593_09685 [Rossellomorea marisflavi]
MATYYPNIDPTYLFKRQGTANDPFIPLVQNITVKTQKVTLKEIPSYIDKVKVTFSNGTSLVEITGSTINAGQYRVDYSTGIVQFNSSENDKELKFDYLGTGHVNIGANRVLLNTSATNNEEVSVQEIIDDQIDLYAKAIESKQLIESNQVAKKSDLALTNAQLADKASNEALVVERARIDRFTTLPTGSTSGDAELIDGRIGVFGATYPNIGSAIREQISERISLVDGLIAKERTSNHIITESVSYGYYYESTAGLKTSASASWWVHPIIRIKPNTLYRKSSCQLAIYDVNKQFISYISYGTISFTSPATAYYVGVCANTDVNNAGLYEDSKYAGVYVKGERLLSTSQIADFANKTKSAIADEYVKRKNGKNLFDKSGVNTEINKGYYVEYNSGARGNTTSSDYVVIPVKGGKTYAINTQSNVHVAFFSSLTYSQTTYLGGVLNAKTVTPPLNAVMMTVSYRKVDTDSLQVEVGNTSTEYESYQKAGIETNDYKNKSVTREKLADDLLQDISSKTIHIGNGYPYTSILRAMKENTGKDVKFVVHTGIYNLVSEYEDFYGSSYFANYAGYASSSDHFDKGLYLDDGVSLIGKGNVEITFPYTGGNTQVHNRFAPINTSQNNTFENINITISDNICRYGIHDDFASTEGTNVFRNCIFKGKSYLNTFIGSGFGKSNTYIIENCVFKEAGGISIAYHNNVASGAKNKLIIKDCHCDGAIRGAQYGASSEVSTMIVSGCKAVNVSVVMTDDTGNNKPNIELVQWNNILG